MEVFRYTGINWQILWEIAQETGYADGKVGIILNNCRSVWVKNIFSENAACTHENHSYKSSWIVCLMYLFSLYVHLYIYISMYLYIHVSISLYFYTGLYVYICSSSSSISRLAASSYGVQLDILWEMVIKWVLGCIWDNDGPKLELNMTAWWKYLSVATWVHYCKNLEMFRKSRIGPTRR